MGKQNIDLLHQEERHFNILNASSEEQTKFMNDVKSTIKRLTMVGEMVHGFEGAYWEHEVCGTGKYLAGTVVRHATGIVEFFICLGDDYDPNFKQVCIFFVNPTTKLGQVGSASDDVQQLIEMMDIFKVQTRSILKNLEFDI